MRSIVAKLLLLPAVVASVAYADKPRCPGVHVWYSLNNASNANWNVQITQIYETNLYFVNEQCVELESQQVTLLPSQTRYVGMKFNVSTGFSSVYSFFGTKQLAADDPLVRAKRIPSCGFFVAPYGPGQMDRTLWQLNNADCYSINYGTDIYFK